MSSAAAKEVLAQAVERGAWDPAFWLRFFLPHWFPSTIPPFHLGIAALVTKKVKFLNEYPEAHEFLLNEFKYSADPDDPTSVELPVFRRDATTGQIVMVAAEHSNIIIPRGFSKTTLMNGLNLCEAVVDGTLFCVYISKSAGHAEMQLGNIRRELEENANLRAAYGDVVPTKSDTEKWTDEQLQLRNGAILVARGRGGQVRGLNYQARRPNRILLDDVEDDDTAKSPTVMKATESWFYSSVEKAGQVMEGAAGEDWAQEPLQIVNLGTLLGAVCLMTSLMKDPKFSTIRFGARLHPLDPESTAMLWPYKMSFGLYQKERARHQRLGKLGEFTRELDSSIRVTDEAIFPNQFIYQPTNIGELVHRSIFMDPAISQKAGADSTALVVAGRRLSDGALWFLDEWGGPGKTPREQIDAFFEYHQKWNCTHAGIEGQAYQAALIFLMREEMARRQQFFVIQSIIRGSDVKKDSRITGVLSPRYSNGYIRHLRPLAQLEGNLADWPNGKKDFADAAASALTLLGESEGLTIPESSRVEDELEHTGDWDDLRPVFRTASNYIIKRNGQPNPVLDGRYG